MKKFLLLLVGFVLTSSINAQAPQAFKFQSVIRDASGMVLPLQDISLKFLIHVDAPDGEVVYAEQHLVTTNASGLANVDIGTGDIISGAFEGISWGDGTYFLEEQIDVGNTGNFQVFGTVQLLSVPYALHANTAGNGVQSMSEEERDDLESPAVGMQIYNTTTNCLNYWNGTNWFETCGECTPQPSDAHAGSDQSYTDSTTVVILEGNTPEEGTGLWTKSSSYPGWFEDPNDPNSTFHGEPCRYYYLKWTISNTCGSNYDYIKITFDNTPSEAFAGQDTVVSSEINEITLYAHTLENGTGEWSVISGDGGTFSDNTDPNAVFTGTSCINYELQWLVYTNCHEDYDTINVEFFSVPTQADAGADQLGLEGTWTTLEANVPEIGEGLWTVLQGEGGQVATSSDPNSIFLGQINEHYILQWQIHNSCDTTWDTVNIAFGFVPVLNCGDTLTDLRDGQKYVTIQIGNQCWMGENLNVGERIDGTQVMADDGIIEKYCYDDDEDNCEIYGGFYDWNEAMQYSILERIQGVCPDGWHIPSESEFCELVSAIDSTINCEGGNSFIGTDAGGKMKTTGTLQAGNGLWQEPNLGATNESGFTALPAGNKNRPGFPPFDNIGLSASIWTSTMENEFSKYWKLNHDYASVLHSHRQRETGFSVRCLKYNKPFNYPPDPPDSPYPGNGSGNQSIETNLSWLCTDTENDPLTFDVYFGDTSPPPELATGVSDTIYILPTLNYSTTYYWRIVAHDDHENITEGDDWSFSTLIDSNWGCGDTLNDTRDDQKYKTVQIFDQCWMAENLNYETNYDSWCYDDYAVNCDIYGRLYQWGIAQTSCPIGWHLPSDNEWEQLVNFLGGTDIAGGKLKDTSLLYWSQPNVGATNESGFTALPGGCKDLGPSYYGINDFGRWWSSSLDLYNGALGRSLSYNQTSILSTSWNQATSRSVRCLYDSVFEPPNVPPYNPSNPKPENGSLNISIDTTIAWSCSDPENAPLTYDVYFGTEPTPPQVATGIADTFYIPGMLEYAITYYWQIVAHDDQGNSTVGEVWSFTTKNGVWDCGEPFIDERDGSEYGTVKIGEQCWMAENLKIGTRIDGNEEMTDNQLIEKYCYDNDPVNCDTYGGLYQWSEMMQYAASAHGICPFGWVLPTDDEWNVLEGTVDSQYPVGDPEWGNLMYRGFDVGKNLKSLTGWWNGGNGIDLFDFSTLPGGQRKFDGSFTEIFTYGFWWSSSVEEKSFPMMRSMNHLSDRSTRFGKADGYGYSVRCLKE